MKQKTVPEIQFKALSGWFMMFLHIVFIAVTVILFFRAFSQESLRFLIAAVVLVVIDVVWINGYFLVNPNFARALVLFGKYRGTVLNNGFFWTNPFTVKKEVSLRIRNLNTDTLKVNDLNGNPVDIAAIVVWKVQDTGHALFDVDDYEEYVNLQCESAVRQMATRYPYDVGDDDVISLRGSQEEVSEHLKTELGERLDLAGIEVLEARLSHLAYAPEIAGAMLRRQQADAVIAARQKIVDGAVGMVEMALAHLSEKGIIDLDDERRASMVSNLMVVLCSEQATHPVINTGTLYQ